MDNARHPADASPRRLVDYYQFLGIPPAAPTDQIVAAYLVKAQDPDPHTQQRAERAIAVLSDPATRYEYDQALAASRALPPASSGPPAVARPAPRPGARPPARGGARTGVRGRPAPRRALPLAWVGGVAVVVGLALGWWAIASASNTGTNPGARSRVLGALRSSNATGGLQLALTVAPDPPRPGPTTFTLQVQDQNGQPVSSAQVLWSMDMTNMRMGPQSGQMAILGAGQYQTRADFDMGGPWRINVEVRNAGQSLGSGSFDLDIR